MLSTAYGPHAVSILALCVAIYAVFFARVAFTRAAVAYHEADRRAPSLKRVADIECELTELKDAYDSLLTSHKKLRSRIGMRELRDQTPARDPDGMPAPDSPDWKKQARVALAKAGKLNARFHTS